MVKIDQEKETYLEVFGKDNKILRDKIRDLQ